MAPMNMDCGRSYVTRAKLDNGEIVAYQLCCDIDSPVSREQEDNYEFVGFGVIHSIDGVELYKGTERHKFYQRRITPLSQQINPDGTLKYSKKSKKTKKVKKTKKSQKPFNRYTALTGKRGDS